MDLQVRAQHDLRLATSGDPVQALARDGVVAAWCDVGQRIDHRARGALGQHQRVDAAVRVRCPMPRMHLLLQRVVSREQHGRAVRRCPCTVQLEQVALQVVSAA